MHRQCGISGLLLIVLNTQDWWNVYIFEYDIIFAFWRQNILLILLLDNSSTFMQTKTM